MSYKIRAAESEDCHSICSLIQELADYYKHPNGPKINADVLMKDGFGSKSYFHAFVAEVGGDVPKIIGYVLYFYTYSTWEGRTVYMEDLYVTPEFRHLGVGTALWRSVAQEGLKNECHRLDFTTLSWNKPSIQFYESKGAINLTKAEDWHLFRLHKEAMEKL